MLDTIGAFGSGIGTNLLSDSLSKKLEAFKGKKAIASFTQSLRDWEIEFEKQNDGTIITNGAFYSHVKYHNVIENIVAYKLDYNSESFRDYHWSQLAILNSMKVEYSRSGQPGGYGDFGRYTFQSYFYAWKQLHPIDLKNTCLLFII